MEEEGFQWMWEMVSSSSLDQFPPQGGGGYSFSSDKRGKGVVRTFLGNGGENKRAQWVPAGEEKEEGKENRLC